MLKKSHIYWYSQVTGWSIFIIVNFVYLSLSSVPGVREYVLYILMLPVSIFITHIYRHFLVKFGILELKIPTQGIYIVVFSFIKGLLLFTANTLLWALLALKVPSLNVVMVFATVFNFSGVFCLWNVIYFGFHYFENYRRSEINSLRHLAVSHESELNNLKAQLNPHFIFNCMNSIRALIDENPVKAKKAILQLSNILRSTLIIDKSKEIFLKDEMSLVSDFLNLEKIRYEERLNYIFKISDEANNSLIPPFIVQSQVENAIKHGISKLTGKGMIEVEAVRNVQELKIKVANTGQLHSQEPLTGVGFKNSIQRLRLLYGSKASISIDGINDIVEVTILIPLK